MSLRFHISPRKQGLLATIPIVLPRHHLTASLCSGSLRHRVAYTPAKLLIYILETKPKPFHFTHHSPTFVKDVPNLHNSRTLSASQISKKHFSSFCQTPCYLVVRIICITLLFAINVSLLLFLLHLTPLFLFPKGCQRTTATTILHSGSDACNTPGSPCHRMLISNHSLLAYFNKALSRTVPTRLPVRFIKQKPQVPSSTTIFLFYLIQLNMIKLLLKSSY